MSIQCPYCRFSMALKGAKPGRYKPSCTQCHKTFGLIISADGQTQVKAMAEAGMVDPMERQIGDILGIETPATAKPAGLRKPPSPSTRPPAATIAPAASPPHNTGPGAPSVARAAPPANKTVAPARQSGISLPAAGDGTLLKPPADDSMDASMPQLSGKLGGYRIERRLGGGGMGSVYLARQLSLDRNVALKVMHPRLARDPQFIARFTREAYAAAQLTHHNVVQIHDIGAEEEVHYFSMEFVEGQSLADLVEREGKLDPEVAVGYALQAARGLKFAHDHGMIHRDIKPDNLLLNDQGIVKVADLGLVKTPESTETTPPPSAGNTPAATRPTITAAQSFMGTPAYMAPEQAQDSTKVDARADIYSLGCTLYDLVTGRPPFVGKTAAEVMTKHLREPIVPPHQIVDRVPEQLSALLMKMVAKQPEQRYSDTGQAIAAMEEYLGIDSTGPFSPREEHARALETAAGQFNGVWARKLRSNLLVAIAGLVVLAVAGMMMAGWWAWAAAFLLLGIMTCISYFTVYGIARRSYLFIKVRELLLGAGVGLWIKLILVTIMVVLTLLVLNLLGVVAGLLIVAIGAACGFYFTIDKLVAMQRESALVQIEDLLRKLRLRGLDENALRQFVCRYASDHWEELYETLFGYEAKMDARGRWGRGRRGQNRPRFAAWRDPIIRWIDARQRARKEERQRRHLIKIEARRLEAAGMKELESRRQARRIAEAMMQKAAEVRQGAAVTPSSRQTAAPSAAPAPLPGPPRGMFDEAIESAQQPAGGRERKFEHHSYIDRKYGGLSGMILGPQARFILGTALLLPFLLWLYQNRAVGVVQKMDENVTQVQTSGDVQAGQDGYHNPQPLPHLPLNINAPRKPLDLIGMPATIAPLLGTWNAGIAAVILLVSALFTGKKLGLLIIPAAALIVAGHLLPNMPAIGVLENMRSPNAAGFLFPTTLAAGLLLSVLGFAFAREKP